MTIGKTGPLVAVIGATGNQGGSVIEALKASSKPYQIRGISRDVSKPKAKELTSQGVEMVAADIADKTAVEKAFEGADIVFAVTDFWQHLDKAKEIADGKRLVDAAKAKNVDLFIWSGLESHSKVSNGKYTHVDHFESKAEITEYAFTTLGKKHVINVMAAGYAQNWTSLMGPRATEHGHVLATVAPVDARFTSIDIEKDYGMFVSTAIENREAIGSEFLACGDEPTWQEVGDAIGAATGKEVKTVSITREQYEAASPAPQAIKDELREMICCAAEYGYFGPKDWRRNHNLLPRKPVTFAEFAKTAQFPTLS